MTCEEFLRALDHEQAASREAAEHRAACPSCRQAWEISVATRHELRTWADQPAPPFLRTRVMAQVRSAPRSSPRPWWAPRPALAGPLLVLAIVVSLGGYGLWRATSPESAVQALGPEAGTLLEQAPPPVETMPAAAAKGAEPQDTAPRRDAAAAAREVRAAGPADRETAEPSATMKVKAAPARPTASRPIAQPPAAAPPVAEARADGVAVSRHAPRQSEAGAHPDDARATPVPARPPIEQQRALGALRREVAAERAGAPAPAVADEPNLVAVDLVASEGAARRSLALEPALTPAPGASWLLEVAGDGGVTLTEARVPPERLPALLQAVRALDLPPGRYRLTRAQR